MQIIRITDDSGYLGIIDPDRYESFVDADWTFASLRAHIVSQMSDRAILIWSTGMEACWRVSVAMGFSDVSGVRKVVGPIDCCSGRLCLVNYETLSMAAQFSDVTIPESHMSECLVEVPKGRYRCRIVQMFDLHAVAMNDEHREFDFLLELEVSELSVPSWNEIAWREASDDVSL